MHCKKITPETTLFSIPEITRELTPLIMLISIHDLVHYNTVHVSGGVLTSRQLDIS